MTMLLFDRIDEPGLNTLEVYERRGGYESLRKALDDGARGGARRASSDSGLRGRGGAGFRMGQKAVVPAPRRHGQVPGLQRRRVRAGHVQGPRADAEEPAHADRGDRDRHLGGRDQPRVHLHPRRVRATRPTSSRRRSPRPQRRRLLGEHILGSDHSLSARAAPRRRRLHLRRGDRAARLARGQARQPAPEAAVPGDRGPLPRPDADQQRRDAVHRARTSSGWAARSTPSIGTETSTGTKLVSVSGDVQRPGNYEIELGIPSREIIYGLAGGPPEGREIKFWFPGGSSSPVLTKDDLDVPYDFDSMAKAGSMLGSGAIIVVDDSHTVLEVALQAGQVLRARVVRQVRAVPRGHQLDGEDARADRVRRGDADGPRHHGLGPGADHRQLPVRARRRDGDADRLDGREVPRRARGGDRGRARARRTRAHWRT